MPPGWIIGPFVIKSSLVILIASFIIGVIFFRLVSPFSYSETKKRLDDVGNLLIVFVISVWIGKILVNFSTFINDPIAILAYPSGSQAFYIAIIFSAIYLKYKAIVDIQHLVHLLFSWMIIFITSSFVYEFIQVIWGSNVMTSGYYSGLLFFLLVSIILLQGILSTETLTLLALIVWSLGQLLLSVFFTTTVFQFYLDRGFYLSVFLISITVIIYIKYGKQRR
ncbi:hypothetical protein GH741_12420 [Aquibacillus halophilus]|uniref:Uncharacterized protein n=1 Tax=Aquibacillus halophilus TaxID=930132 RepID=A0A6A8DCS9_9BACI|nr:hypothetical protein [Aquibacillus halophilus]MRH43483.1 hypothetical protein [Aquibacillus halophilus]